MFAIQDSLKVLLIVLCMHLSFVASAEQRSKGHEPVKFEIDPNDPDLDNIYISQSGMIGFKKFSGSNSSKFKADITCTDQNVSKPFARTFTVKFRFTDKSAQVFLNDEPLGSPISDCTVINGLTNSISCKKGDVSLSIVGDDYSNARLTIAKKTTSLFCVYRPPGN